MCVLSTISTVQKKIQMINTSSTSGSFVVLSGIVFEIKKDMISF